MYFTHEEIFGAKMEHEELVGLIGQLAVDDCLLALSRLSCMVEGEHVAEPGRQVQILCRLGFTDDLIGRLGALMPTRPGRGGRVFFFPQQIIHLTRLVLRHADRRPPDDFGGGQLSGVFIRVLFGVSDAFGPELVDGTRASARGLVLRQLGLASRAYTLYAFSRYHELLVNLWPEVIGSDEFDPADAFLRYTGLTLERFFMIGFVVYTRFLNHVDQVQEPNAGDFVLNPRQYFSSTTVTDQEWAAFSALLSARPDELLDRLDAEDALYGPTTYRAHTFDRKPLVEVHGGLFVPTSFAALERAVTEGAFWLLADAVEAEGRRREDFTGPFGRVFERFAQQSLERIAALEADSPQTFRDELYGPKNARTLSSDMTFVYNKEAVFFEVVTGQPNVKTVTRGDPVAFRNDLRRLVQKKASQLRRCWQDFMVYGRLKFDGVGHGQIHTVWPALVLIEGFPLMPPIYGEVEERLRADGWPKTAPRLTLLDADELAALERMVEEGWSVLDVLRAWKHDAAHLPMSNWLYGRPDLFPKGLGHATWHGQRFEAISQQVMEEILRPS